MTGFLDNAGGDGVAAGGYTIDNSLRFRASASAYLSRTPGTTSNRRLWTFSCWMKRGTLSTNGMSLISAGTAFTNGTSFYFSSDQLIFNSIIAGSSRGAAYTPAVLRDPSSWYHILLSVDTAQTSFANGWAKIWINGTQQTLSQAASPVQNHDTFVNLSTNAVWLARDIINSNYFDGYLSEINFTDGQALTPSDFGEFNSDGVWVPKAYNGTYGTNGFYLPFDDATSTTTLGYDRSGNGNNWTCNNISLTAGVTYDHMVDTPTNNYATLNPLDKNANTTLAVANLNLVGTGNPTCVGASQCLPTTGKWYMEWKAGTVLTGGVFSYIGLFRSATYSLQSNTGSGYISYQANTGNTLNDISATGSTSGTVAAGDMLALAVDMDAGTVQFLKNNTSLGTITGTLNTADWRFGIVHNNTIATAWEANFGQRPFTYTPPTGFKALCTANIPDGGSITTSGNFTGNASANGPYVWLNGNPETMTINGNAVTWGTHADKLAGGFKVRSSSASYNTAGSNTFSVTLAGELFGDENTAPNTAQGNPL
jgi:hypothetical protein